MENSNPTYINKTSAHPKKFNPTSKKFITTQIKLYVHIKCKISHSTCSRRHIPLIVTTLATKFFKPCIYPPVWQRAIIPCTKEGFEFNEVLFGWINGMSYLYIASQGPFLSCRSAIKQHYFFTTTQKITPWYATLRLTFIVEPALKLK